MLGLVNITFYKVSGISNYTQMLSPWSRVLLEKLTILQLVKKFPVFCGNRRFITAFSRAHHLSLSRARFSNAVYIILSRVRCKRYIRYTSRFSNLKVKVSVILKIMICWIHYIEINLSALEREVLYNVTHLEVAQSTSSRLCKSRTPKRYKLDGVRHNFHIIFFSAYTLR
jgi:hypothetical protein